MTKKANILIAMCAVVALATAFTAGLRAQGATSVNGGVFTADQAKKGAAVYVDKCAPCHGEDLAGQAGIIPALTGDPWLMNWNGKTLGDLYDKIFMTMPALEPGSLKPEEAAALVANILSVGKYPAGSTEVAAKVEALQGIKIEAKK